MSQDQHVGNDELAENDEHGTGENGPVPAESSAVMDLLAQHVPLALLMDLAPVDGPVSQAILETEGLPEHAWWEEPQTDAELDRRASTGTSPGLADEIA